MTNTEPLTPTSVGLPPELRRRLDVAAQTLRRKRAEVIRFAITEYLDRHEQEVTLPASSLEVGSTLKLTAQGRFVERDQHEQEEEQ